ncbi:hypothetical protein OBBRIDRAFT_830069 [Obba rivulosa]|uniref:Uncharacterized protein n=1 Tax=Obba rivulosa TaxID=1052685 RepID=A0A8E2J7J1_9APHY|nr:hypothetical protein OBBRIDRAFT_830069 [Obba rivulosa]
MRCTVLASLFAATMIGTELACAVPAPSPLNGGLARRAPQVGVDTITSLFGPPPTNTNNFANNEAALRKYTDGQARAMQVAQQSAGSQTKTRRAQDSGTAGGNAYTGSTDSVSGGSVANVASDDATITNNGDSNQGGSAGTTESGIATAGNGDGLGPGGNAYSGSSGNARGGTVLNKAGVVDNEGTGSNLAGNGGTSITGEAFGGNSGSGFDNFDDNDNSDFLARINGLEEVNEQDVVDD